MISGPADPKSSQAQPSWVVGPPVPPAIRLGQLIDGEFLIKGILGQGELGVTYEADNTRLKRRFAVLMLNRGLKPTHAMMLAVRDDLRRAQQLTAAGLMPVKLIADRDGIPGFATELLEGETLRGRLGRGPLRVERALAVVLSVARTLEAAHKVGLIHGDLRPENIFLVRPSAKSAFAGKAMIVEHALHHLRRRAPGLDDRLPLYKLMYRPPEQVLGEAGASEQGDVWVLGAILYECLTGKPAFYAEEPEFVLDNLGSPPPPLQPNAAIGLHSDLAATLNLLIASACSRDLESRILNMTEFLEGLEQLVRGAALKLPEVIVESREEAAAAPPPASPPNRRMNRLLQRLSGVFPQIQLPGPGSQPPTSDPAIPKITPSAPSPESKPQPAASESGSAPKLQPIVPPKERVSRILQKLSGAYPTISGPPVEELESLSLQPPVAAPKPAAGPDEGANKLAGPAPISDISTPKASDLDRALSVLKKQREQAAAPAPKLPPDQPTLKADVPDAARLPAAPLDGPTLPPVAPPAPPEKAELPTTAPLLEALPRPWAEATAGERSTHPPVEPAPVPTPETIAPLPPVETAAKPAEPQAPPPGELPPSEVAVPPTGPTAKIEAAVAEPAPALQPKDPVAELAAPVAKPATPSEKSPAPAVLAVAPAEKSPPPIAKPEEATPTSAAAPAEVLKPSAKTPALPTEVLKPSAKTPALPTEAPRPSAKTPALPTEVLKPSARSSEPLAEAPKSSSSSPVQIVRTEEPSARLAVEPAFALTSSAKPAPVPALASAPEQISVPVPAQAQEAPRPSTKSPETSARFSPPTDPAAEVPTVKPRDVSISSAETPKANPAEVTTSPKQPDFSLDATLQPDDLAEVLDASSPGMPLATPALTPVSTPAVISALTPIGAPSEAERSLPKLKTPLSEIPTNPAIEAMVEKLSPIKAAAVPALTEQTTQPALRRLPITELATQAKLDVLSSEGLAALATATGNAAAAAVGTSAPAAAAQETPRAAVAPPPTPPAAVPAPPPPPAEATAPRPPRPPRVSQLIAALQANQGPPPPMELGTAAPPDSARRVSPGLMDPAPDILSGSSSISVPSNSEEVVASPPPPAGPLGWMLRHQEAVAALIGATLVVLAALLYVFLKPL